MADKSITFAVLVSLWWIIPPQSQKISWTSEISNDGKNQTVLDQHMKRPFSSLMISFLEKVHRMIKISFRLEMYILDIKGIEKQGEMLRFG